MIKYNKITILIVTFVFAFVLTGCFGGKNSNYVFKENDKDRVVVFRFEDEEHRQMIEKWLKTVLYAEDYYEFIDGEDYDAPLDFSYEGATPGEG